jgi:hypothetical protein
MVFADHPTRVLKKGIPAKAGPQRDNFLKKSSKSTLPNMKEWLNPLDSKRRDRSGPLRHPETTLSAMKSLVCFDDADTIEKAKRLVDGHQVELSAPEIGRMHVCLNRPEDKPYGPVLSGGTTTSAVSPIFRPLSALKFDDQAGAFGTISAPFTLF